MNVHTSTLAAMAACLPHLPGAPVQTPPVTNAYRAMGGGAGSPTVADALALAAYMDELAQLPALPDGVRILLLAVRDALLGRRVRTRHHGNGRDSRAGGSRRRVTATVDVAL